jgi:hypothetical protein
LHIENDDPIILASGLHQPAGAMMAWREHVNSEAHPVLLAVDACNVLPVARYERIVMDGNQIHARA